MLESFTQNFWTCCTCSRNCFIRVDYSRALALFEEYDGMFEEQKDERLGGIIQNFEKVTSSRSNVSNDHKHYIHDNY